MWLYIFNFFLFGDFYNQTGIRILCIILCITFLDHLIMLIIFQNPFVDQQMGKTINGLFLVVELNVVPLTRSYQDTVQICN